MSEGKWSEDEMWNAEVIEAGKRKERGYDNYAIPVEILFWADAKLAYWQGEVVQRDAELTRLRAIVARVEDVGPGDVIAAGPCPSCGTNVRLEHGDDEGEYMAITENKESLWTKEQ